jgi:hypothetical protein
MKSIEQNYLTSSVIESFFTSFFPLSDKCRILGNLFFFFFRVDSGSLLVNVNGSTFVGLDDLLVESDDTLGLEFIDIGTSAV